MKKILFPTNFSETANNAFVYALNIAARMGASITTVHAYTMPDVGATAGFVLPNTLKEFYDSVDIEAFDNYRQSLPSLRKIADEEGFDQVEMRHALVEGSIVRTIVNLVKDEGYDLIVMGTDGARGLKEIFLGTNAAEIMEHADCPVLGIPAKAKFDGDLNKFAVTTEFKAEEASGIQHVIDFAKLFDAHVTCINVDLEHTHQYLNRMKDLEAQYAHESNISFEVVEGMNLEKTIHRYLDENQMDVLAIMTHKRSFIEELFHYSIAKQLAYHVSTPILAIPAHILK